MGLWFLDRERRRLGGEGYKAAYSSFSLDDDLLEDRFRDGRDVRLATSLERVGIPEGFDDCDIVVPFGRKEWQGNKGMGAHSRLGVRGGYVYPSPIRLKRKKFASPK